MMRVAIVVVLLLAGISAGQPAAQNPAPMVEHTRSHTRLREERPPGQRIPLTIGTLFLPEKLPADRSALLVHCHGAPWIAELAAAKAQSAVIAVQLGAGSGTYAKPFADPKAFANLVQEAETKANRKFDVVGLSGWSAGYGGIRAILKSPDHYDRVQFIILLDGLHAGYVGGKPAPKESTLVADDLTVFVNFARDAAAGKKQFLLTHSEIFPGTFASTTETADFLLKELNLKRQPVLRWGPLGTQILGEAKRGGFHLLGFAGNSAPDHIDLLHALPDFMQMIDLAPRRLHENK